MAVPSKTQTKEARSVKAPRSSGAEVADFLARASIIAPVSSGGRGRLIFAMDATMSNSRHGTLRLGCRRTCSMP
jgi:hypothetical protein